MTTTPNRAALDELCRAFDLHILYAFGSRGREAPAWLDGDGGRLPPGPSDLDVGVKPAGLLPVRRKVELAVALEDLFDVGRVDLVALPEADPFLAVNIIRGERLLADDAYLADDSTSCAAPPTSCRSSARGSGSSWRAADDARPHLRGLYFPGTGNDSHGVLMNPASGSLRYMATRIATGALPAGTGSR